MHALHYLSSKTLIGFWSMVLLCFSLSNSMQAQGCSQPSNLNTTNLTTTSVRLSWSAIQGSSSYTVQYRVGSVGAWTTISAATATNLTLNGLLQSTVYTWRVRASCSTYSSVATFNTGGSGGNPACSQPSNLNIANLSTTSVNLTWSAISGAFNYTVQYRVGTTGAWTTTSATTGTSLTLSGLIASTVYTWRVKASCSVYSSVATFNTGGSGGNPSCSQPSNLNEANLLTSSVNLTWSAISGAFDYTVQYRVSTSTTWITTSATTATNLTLAGLLGGTEYSWRVKASCSEYSSIAVFTTDGTGTGGGGGGSTSCSSPSNTNTDVVQPTSATVSWEPQGGALNYTVQYRLATSTTYLTVGTVTNSIITIIRLQAGREYVWRVKANCSPYGSDVQFTTPLTALRTAQITNEPATAVSIFPNPANDQIQIRAALAGTQVMILDATGRTLATDIIRDNIHTLNVSQLNNGIYLVRLTYDNQPVQTERFLIAR